MDDLLSRLQSFPPSSPINAVEYDKQARQFAKKLEDISTKSLTSTGSDGHTLLDLISPADNSIAHLAVLNANVDLHRSKSNQDSVPQEVLPGSKLWARLVAFYTSFDSVQVRYVGTSFRQLLELMVAGAEQSKQPFILVPLLRETIFRLDSTSSTLTSAHVYFVYLCLKLKLYQDALPVIQRTIHNVPSSQERKTATKSQILCAQESSAGYLTVGTGLTNRITTREYLSYFLYSAMISIALRQWEDAIKYLETVLVVPSTNTASMIMVEAYKKYALLGLLVNGKPLSPPRSVNPQAMKHIRSIARPYDVIAEAFGSKDFERLRGDIEVGQREGLWAKDNNLGLIYEVTNAFRKFTVLRLGKTFDALPISDVARRISPDPTDHVETQNYIAGLIASGDLKAVISSPSQQSSSKSTPILRFLPQTSTTKSEKELEVEIEMQKSELSMLLEQISMDDHRLELSKDYIEHILRLRKGKEDEEKLSRAQQGPPSAGGSFGGQKGTGPGKNGSSGGAGLAGSDPASTWADRQSFAGTPAGRSGFGGFGASVDEDVDDEDVMAET